MIDFTHWPALLFGALAVLAGALVQGSTGIGLGIIAGPILLIINPFFVPGPLLVLAFMLASLVSAREWRSIDRKGLAIALAGRLPGSLLAGLTMSLIPLPAYELLFGLLVLGGVLFSLTGWSVLPTMRNLFTAGLASGYMGTLTSIGAPPMALAYQHGTPATIRSTMSAFFVVGSAFSIAVLTSFGRFAATEVWASLIFVPPLVAGFWVSHFVVPRMNAKLIRYSVLGLSGVSSVVLITKAVLWHFRGGV